MRTYSLIQIKTQTHKKHKQLQEQQEIASKKTIPDSKNYHITTTTTTISIITITITLAGRITEINIKKNININMNE